MQPMGWVSWNWSSSCMGAPPIAFVAYSSRDAAITQLVGDAVYVANGNSDRVRYETWVYNDIPGNPLISPILDRIEESAFIIADITTLNLNVVYEIAFAIGRRKRAYLIRHQGTAGDKAVAREAGIFDTLGYHEYSDQDDLVRRLTSNIDPEPLTFSVELDHRAPVYLIEPPAKGIAVTAMIARLKKARYRYRSFIPGEDVRLSAVDAIRQVASSSGVLVTLEAPTKPHALVHNIRSMFVAGFADGMGKPLLVLCPAGTDAPLDVRDDVKHYRSEGDITDHIADFVLEVTDHLQQDAPPPIETGSLLQSLRIGDPTAENEMATLSEYYLQTDEYQRALHGSVNLAVGRKGSGKTALFIQLRDKIRRDKRNVVVDLRPEGYQLIKLKEDILEYLSEGSRQHLIITFWEYLILLEVAYKLLEKDQYTHKHNHEIVHRQHSWDKLGRLKKGVFLAHRSVHRSEDETAFQFGEGSGREGRQGHPPGDTQAVFGGGKDPDRFGRPARRGQHRRAVPPRGYRAEPVLSLVEGLPGGWQEAPGR